MSNQRDSEYMNKWYNKIRAATGYMHGPGVEGEALLHMEELGNYTLKYLARRRTRKPPHDLVTGQTPDYMLSN